MDGEESAERGLLDNSSIDEQSLDDYDIAITHCRNAELESRPLVKQFFEDIQMHMSLASSKTRSWLGNLPFYMCQDAVPLFVDDSTDDSTDYQLHPCYTSLEIDKTATKPDPDLFYLLRDSERLEHPILVIGIGRLFVNARNSAGGRTSKWTGYEVFVDQELALWMVFDDALSQNPRAEAWYPVPSGFTSNDNDHIPSFGLACFLPSLHELANINFEKARNTVAKTMRSGKMRLRYVEKSVVDSLLRTKIDSPDNEPLVVDRGRDIDKDELAQTVEMDAPDLSKDHKHMLGLMDKDSRDFDLGISAEREDSLGSLDNLRRIIRYVVENTDPEIARQAQYWSEILEPSPASDRQVAQRLLEAKQLRAGVS